MKKSLTYALGMFFALALVIVPLSLMNVFAAGSADVVFLRDGSAGDGSSPDQALGTLNAAYDALDLTKDCTIVVCGAFTQELTF